MAGKWLNLATLVDHTCVQHPHSSSAAMFAILYVRSNWQQQQHWSTAMSMFTILISAVHQIICVLA